MRKLSADKRKAILHALVEACSIRGTSRLCGVSKLTVLRLLADIGHLCRDYHDFLAANVAARTVQVDEMWSFVGSKENTKRLGGSGHGDCWTWVAVDADSKLAISYLPGLRDGGYATEFMRDLPGRLADRVQLTSDGYKVYHAAVQDAFGRNIDSAQLEKYFGKPEGNTAPERRYRAAMCIGTRKALRVGKPDPALVSRSYAQRQNRTMRMSMRGFTRLSNAFRKKWANHEHAIALHYFYHNICRVHMTLETTPAMPAGVADKAWTLDDLVGVLLREERLRANGGRINREDRT